LRGPRLLVFDPAEAVRAPPPGGRRNEVFLGRLDRRRGRLGELEDAEGLLELPAYPCKRRVRSRGDHRPDVFEREPDRTGLERRQPWRETERVAPELLVDVDLAVAKLGIHR